MRYVKDNSGNQVVDNLGNIVTTERADLETMDWAFKGQPFVDVPGKDSIDLMTMDWAFKGQPFVSNALLAIVTPTGTNMKVNIGDSWKDVDSIKINIGDTWKDVSKIQINIGDAWKTVFG